MKKSLDEIKIVISKLRIIDKNNDYAYEVIEKIIKNDLVEIALPSVEFEPGLVLHRCRNNYDDNEHETISDLSYRTDIENITTFGRANMPNQSIFYSSDIRPTAISETNKAFRGENYKDVDEISITTGHWTSTQKLRFTLIINNKNAQEKNELVRLYKIDIDKITEELFNTESEKITEILNFVADEFSINTHGNTKLYKISCAFAQLAYETSDGIIYPSLQRNLEGLNFAVKPESVSKLEFINATHDKFEKEGETNFNHSETREALADTKYKLVWDEPVKIEKPE